MWLVRRRRRALLIVGFVCLCFTFGIITLSVVTERIITRTYNLNRGPVYNISARWLLTDSVLLVETNVSGKGYGKNDISSWQEMVTSATLTKELGKTKENKLPRSEWQSFEKIQSFRPKLDKGYYLAMLSVWKDFTRFCNLMGFSFILYGGTLLGSYRHHGFIPWDDDLDVLMNVSYRSQIFRKLSQLTGHQIVPVRTEPGSYYYKFFKLPKGVKRANQYDGVWGFYWPFVDIFFFSENSTHIIDISWVDHSLGYFSWEKDKYFPLKKRPLEGEMYNVPCDVEYALRQAGNGDTSICISSWYDHIRSITLKWTVLYCGELFAFYPFVNRKIENGSLTEALVLNGTTLNTYVFEESRCEMKPPLA